MGENWQSQLAALIKELNIRHAFDCIAGEITGQIFTMLPPGSTLWVYGRLSDAPVSGIQPLDLIYRGKKIQGFLMTTWIMQGGYFRAMRRGMRTGNIIKNLLDTVFASDFKDTSLADMQTDYCGLKSSGATGKKMRVRLA